LSASAVVIIYKERMPLKTSSKKTYLLQL
jgi:hypothetical protein